MNHATEQLALFVVIVLCGYVVAIAPQVHKIAAFSAAVMAAGLSIYIHWKNSCSSPPAPHES